jgi:hypothetical protein
MRLHENPRLRKRSRLHIYRGLPSLCSLTVAELRQLLCWSCLTDEQMIEVHDPRSIWYIKLFLFLVFLPLVCLMTLALDQLASWVFYRFLSGRNELVSLVPYVSSDWDEGDFARYLDRCDMKAWSEELWLHVHDSRNTNWFFRTWLYIELILSRCSKASGMFLNL